MSLISSKFKDALDKELKPNESLYWSSQPNTLYSVYRSFGMFLSAIPWNGGLFFFLEPVFQKQQLPPIHLMLFLSPFLLIGLYMFFSPLIAYFKAQKTLYVVTNKRAFTLMIGKKNSIENFSVKNISVLKKIERTNGSGDIMLMRSHHTDCDDAKKTTDYGFFALPNVAEAERNLEMLLSNR